MCTTELGRVQQLVPEFEKRGFKLIALSCDNVESHKGWIEDIKAYNNLGSFSYPIIADPKREIATQLGMLDPVEKDSKGLPLTCRAVSVRFVLHTHFLFLRTLGKAPSREFELSPLIF